MAKRRKVKASSFRPNDGPNRRMGLTAEIKRTSGRNNMAFMACVSFAGRHPHARFPGKVGGKRNYDNSNYMACAPGSAPRRALAAALKRLGQAVVKRDSAFRGFGSPKGRKHRGFKRRGRGIFHGYGGFGSPKGRQHRGAPWRKLRRGSSRLFY